MAHGRVGHGPSESLDVMDSAQDDPDLSSKQNQHLFRSQRFSLCYQSMLDGIQTINAANRIGNVNYDFTSFSTTLAPNEGNY